MSQSQATDQFHRFVEMWNTGNVEGLEDVFTDDAVYHVPPFPDMGPQALGQFILAFVQTFPDSRVVVDEDIIAGDVSAHRWTWQATYTGES
ncbi:MAG TPA: nuclear transport factor 2 family protein, partial [Anaerolineae bacterium]|nr:nuclear transport factor 2 family protein [Anaerolineae bacterium]